jgi:tubulin monoglycylase TTLL3/8
VLGNKKALFATMKKYYEVNNEQVFNYLPLTFHIETGLDDKEYFKFLNYFYKKDKEEKQNKKIHNIWIIKPGEFTNRGNGITVCSKLSDIKAILKNVRKLDNWNNRTYIVQEYLDKPFLYCKRKFDIRHYMLITCVNGQIKGYWYQLGYIRTTSFEYSLNNSLSSVHLTNDAVQKLLPEYGKYEKGNKLSYEDFEKYL